MFDTLYLTLFRDAILFVGIIISWLYWEGQVSKREYIIANLQDNMKYKKANMSDSEKRLQKQETEFMNLNTKLSQGEETIRSLAEQVDEKESSINHLELSIANLENKNKDLTTRAEKAEAIAEDLKKLTQEQETKIKNSIRQLNLREGTIHGLTVTIKEKDDTINQRARRSQNAEKKYKRKKDHFPVKDARFLRARANHVKKHHPEKIMDLKKIYACT